jgi:hypothetical protein
MSIEVEYSFFDRPVPPIIGIPMAVAVIVLSVVTLPLTVPLHVLLRRTGRRGFFLKNGDQRFMTLGPESFRKEE